MLRKKEKPAAEIFSVSYVAGTGDNDRPVTFVFNGGPGASSAYLHVGAVGPQRVAFPADGTLPPMPPRLVQNDESWLAFTDLVFVDPVGTGFSRVIERRQEGRRRVGRRQEERRRDRSEGVLRLQARPRVAVRVHGTLALGQRSLGLTGLHRRRELRRVSRRASGAHAPGDGRDRAERRDPDLARARDLDARLGRLRRSRVGRPAADDGGCRGPSRALACIRRRHAARRRAARSRGVRHRRLHLVPDPRCVDARRRPGAHPHAARRSDRALARPGVSRRGTHHDARVLA